MNSANEIWQEMLAALETSVKTVAFDVFVNHIEPVAVVNGKMVLAAPPGTKKSFIVAEFGKELTAAMKGVNPLLTDIEVINNGEKDDYAAAVSTAVDEQEPAYKAEATLLNPKYNFENFVVGNSNRFAHAAARAVAEDPGKSYNPLFIYGGVGLGKTHVMHAIGNHLRRTRPDLKVLYVSSENFLNELVASIRTNKDEKSNFRTKYRSADVLMIDDIQFITGRSGTQEEMFNTFNDLYLNNKQLIMTSDRPPREIPDIEERLRSRFEWGLTADIQPPDIETRIAILQKKAQLENHNLPTDALTLMAEKIETNIREMEGLLNKVIFLSKLSEKPVSVELVREALKDYGSDERSNVTAEGIIDSTCKYFRISREDLVGKKKNKEVVEPRQICIYLITDMLDLPLATIGNIFGGRDHTTIMHARDKITEKISVLPRLAMVVKDIKSIVGGK